VRFRLVVDDKNWPLLTGGCCSEVVIKAGLTVQSFLNIVLLTTLKTTSFDVLAKICGSSQTTMLLRRWSLQTTSDSSSSRVKAFPTTTSTFFFRGTKAASNLVGINVSAFERTFWELKKQTNRIYVKSER
jgi:hypothetical protein